MFVRLSQEQTELYHQWLLYFSRQNDARPDYERRTDAYFHAVKEDRIPLMVVR